MKSLIKTYVAPLVEERIKILANKSGSSVSALVSELLNQALNQHENCQTEISNEVIEQQLYLQYLTLIVLLEIHGMNEAQYNQLKEHAQTWAMKKVSEVM
jgi:hypothetical protein